MKGAAAAVRSGPGLGNGRAGRADGLASRRGGVGMNDVVVEVLEARLQVGLLVTPLGLQLLFTG